MYHIKPIKEYQNIIEISNKNIRFKELWHKHFAPKKYISDDNYLCDKYRVMDKFIETGNFNETLNYFIEQYLSDFIPEYDYDFVRWNNVTWTDLEKYKRCGRNEQQLTLMASRIANECKDNAICLLDGVERDIEKMKDLIIGHACYETLIGFYNEAYIRKYLTEKKGENLNTLVDNDEANTTLDSNGVDIFVSDENNKIKALIQVKPITFITGRVSEDLRKDRAKCYENDKRIASYVKNNHDKFSNKAPLEWFYVFYDKKVTDKGDFNFNDESIIMFSDNIIPDNKNHIFVKKEYLWNTEGNTLFNVDFINKNIKRIAIL